MAVIQRILVGLDLHHGDRLASRTVEPTSMAALEQAIEVAEACGAGLVLCAVLELSEETLQLLDADRQNLFQTVEDQARTDLELQAATLRTRGLTVETEVRFGHAWEELTRVAMTKACDLVVVGTRKRSSLARMVFGSNSHHLMRVCPVPVWVVKPGEVRELREVLLASDFNDDSLQAARVAVSIAQLLKAKLFVLHALEFPFDAYLQTAGVSEYQVAQYRQQTHAEARANLEEQLRLADYRTVEPGVVIDVVEGSPDTVIPQYVDAHEVDLLVIGTHARHGVSAVLLGNTAERVLPYVHCSVLAIKPTDFVSPVKP